MAFLDQARLLREASRNLLPRDRSKENARHFTLWCQPDLAYASVKLSQANACPYDHHFHGVKQSLKYLYSTRDDGIHFWHTAPCIKFKEGPIPHINNNKQDLLLNEQPEYDATVLHAYADLDWANCVTTL